MVAEEKNTMVEIKMVLVNLRIFPFSNKFFLCKEKNTISKENTSFYKLTFFYAIILYSNCFGSHTPTNFYFYNS